MGICSSCQATAAAVEATATVKVVLQDGKLEEFSRPVKAANVLQKDPTCFVCNSDDMEFGGFVSAVSADEELQPGQLYFLLPLSELRRPIRAEEMATLAVRASAALMSGASSASRCHKGSLAPLVFPAGGRRSGVEAGGGGGGRVAMAEGDRRRPRRAGGRGRSFTSKLSAIAE
ncbi:uncharacterized protein LOC103707479 [Phoenix dactylifera]|uniref:Uncharacterized protein LOC103707479 n=1 Tax=Phoenix dactylifera TaxID=42345 RepID=A0A8B7C2B0_PHODC|nr:uncharacterized protein LOC103707479 [Phoenix dactylifera]